MVQEELYFLGGKLELTGYAAHSQDRVRKRRPLSCDSQFFFVY
uniref:Uncharacterized protein n=1 Tax=Setaria viridis TaxID=4556 RepID=A0A4U6WHX7_SETVI|nr:hypothetical protein SEVIR_1G337600v2 [Setaria viridis]